ncbi:MAG: hypothetical protein ABI247_11320 [Rhodanobacter sp.]
MSVKYLILFTMAFALTLGLSGCDRGGKAPPSNTAGVTSGAIHGDLQITSWGPDRTKAGVIFNAQPDGNAALWIRVNHSLDGTEATIDFNGHPLTAAVQGELVTTSVPSSLYAAPGTYPLHVSVKQGASVVHSNDVKFVVE